ncbi:MAG TPA: isoprenylcysteine carboxylmethyltransferase family protein [Thermomicrobiaceae bacterium]|nr:isoprenylcysteine carboxylmethyltransferase family protein [Thermomicrobiaceae bacterium]
MSRLDSLERWARRIGVLEALLVLATVAAGIWRAARRPRGRTEGRGSMPLYAAAGAVEVGAMFLAYRPIPVRLSRLLRAVALASGSLLFTGGVALALWGRLALGEDYNISALAEVELFAGQRLVTTGPFALVRHPMYLGVILGAAGGVLLYRTWTLALLLASTPTLVVRARREERALAAEFGEEWRAYARRVPAGLPLVGD